MPRYSLSSIESTSSSVSDVPVPAAVHDLSPSSSQRLHRLPLAASSTSTRFAQLSPVLAIPPWDMVGRRRCSSPGAFLHMIREDEAATLCCWDVDEGVGDVGRRPAERKTSLGMDDLGSPLQPELAWSRKTSATSGYSDTMPPGSWTESRKTSLADDDRLGSSPERVARAASPTMSHSYNDDVDDQRLAVPGPPVIGPRPSLSVPTFHLVIDDADVMHSDEAP